MKKGIVLLLATLLMGMGYAQSWEAQAIGLLPANYGVFGISVVSDSVVWAVAFDRYAGSPVPNNHIPYVLRTTDGGNSWNVYHVADARGRICYDIHAFNADSAFISTQGLGSSAGRGIFRTRDGGSTWTNVWQHTSGGVWIDFFDEKHGIAINRQFMAVTDDAGDTWKNIPQSAFPPFYNNEYTLLRTGNSNCQIMQKTVWFSTNQKRIYRSRNGGQSWEAFSLQTPGNAFIWSMAFVDQDNGLAILSDQTLIRTADGGETWETIPNNASEFAHTIDYLPGSDSTFVITSSRLGDNISAISYDYGRTWEDISTEHIYGGTQFLSEEVGWSSSGLIKYPPEPAIFKFNPCRTIKQVATVYACEKYIWEATGDTLDTAGEYSITLQSSQGCDSILELVLNLDQLQPEVNVVGDRLETFVPDASYQWLTCNNGTDYQPIDGATTRTYTPEKSGTYAVVASTSFCSDTSTCVSLLMTDIDLREEFPVRLYPNPAADQLFLEIPPAIQSEPLHVQVIGLLGQIVLEEELHSHNEGHILDLQPLDPGPYVLRIRRDKQYFQGRFIKK